MAVGDAVGNLVSVVAGGSLDIRPAVGEEWMVFNIFAAGGIEIYWTDGTNEILIDSSAGAKSWLNFKFPVTNTLFLRIKNPDAVNAVLVGYSGVQTK